MRCSKCGAQNEGGAQFCANCGAPMAVAAPVPEPMPAQSAVPVVGRAAVQYMVKAFVPTVAGCGATNKGWDEDRCTQYQNFLNTYAAAGWKLHSCEYRSVVQKGGCFGTNGVWLICTFEKAV